MSEMAREIRIRAEPGQAAAPQPRSPESVSSALGESTTPPTHMTRHTPTLQHLTHDSIEAIHSVLQHEAPRTDSLACAAADAQVLAASQTIDVQVTPPTADTEVFTASEIIDSPIIRPPANVHLFTTPESSGSQDTPLAASVQLFAMSAATHSQVSLSPPDAKEAGAGPILAASRATLASVEKKKSPAARPSLLRSTVPWFRCTVGVTCLLYTNDILARRF